MNFEYGLSAKLLDLLKQIAPDIERVAVLRDRSNPAGTAQFGSLTPRERESRQGLQDAVGGVTSIACTTDIGNMDLAPNLADVCHDFAELAPHCEIDYLPDGSMSIATDRAVHDVNLVISSLKSMRTRPKSPNVATHW